MNKKTAKDDVTAFAGNWVCACERRNPCDGRPCVCGTEYMQRVSPVRKQAVQRHYYAYNETLGLVVQYPDWKQRDIACMDLRPITHKKALRLAKKHYWITKGPAQEKERQSC